MPIGTSDGEYHEDQHAYEIAQADGSTRPSIRVPVGGPDTDSTMPLGGSTEPAGEFKSEIGSQVAPISNNAPVSPAEALPDIDDVPHHDWVESLAKGLYDSAKSGFTLPGDVLSGEVQPESPEAIGRAAELAQLVTGTGIATAKPGTLGTGGSLLSPKTAVDEYWNLMKQGLQKDASNLHVDHINGLEDEAFQQYHDLWSKAKEDNKFTQIPYNPNDNSISSILKTPEQVSPQSLLTPEAKAKYGIGTTDYSFLKQPTTTISDTDGVMTKIKAAIASMPKATEYSSVEEALMHHIYEDEKISPAQKFKLAAMNLVNDFKARMTEHKSAYRQSIMGGTPDAYTLPAFRGMAVHKEGGIPNPEYNYGGHGEDSYGMLFSSNSPMLADMYAGHLSKHPGYHVPEGVFPEGAQVMPLLINPKDYHIYDAKGANWSGVQPEAVRQAKKAGKVGVIMKNVHDEPQSGKTLPPKDVFITFPNGASTVKSRFAEKFDPSSPNMMHMIPMVGAAGAAGLISVRDQNKT